ncbi:unnamed protein product [Polarella glacialis]|uniref:Uncharacterized protein n=1 Tax=Polarella glacialis TaxID=89957 RepID=A0A813GQL3_POLGL|nr:unnamed protein product [Polarella glacialis]
MPKRPMRDGRWTVSAQVRSWSALHGQALPTLHGVPLSLSAPTAPLAAIGVCDGSNGGQIFATAASRCSKRRDPGWPEEIGPRVSQCRLSAMPKHPGCSYT